MRAANWVSCLRIGTAFHFGQMDQQRLYCRLTHHASKKSEVCHNFGDEHTLVGSLEHVLSTRLGTFHHPKWPQLQVGSNSSGSAMPPATSLVWPMPRRPRRPSRQGRSGGRNLSREMGIWVETIKVMGWYVVCPHKCIDMLCIDIKHYQNICMMLDVLYICDTIYIYIYTHILMIQIGKSSSGSKHLRLYLGLLFGGAPS